MSNTVKVLIGLAVCISCCCLGGAFLGFRPWTGGSSTYQEALAFGRPTLERIGKNWDSAEIERLASKEFQSALTANQRQAIYQRFSGRFGPLEETSNWRFVKISWLNTGTFVTMTCDARFGKGRGTAQLTCVKREGRWQIAGLQLNPASK